MEYEFDHLPQKQIYDDMVMAVDTNEEDWCRMHDIVITNGQVVYSYFIFRLKFLLIKFFISYYLYLIL